MSKNNKIINVQTLQQQKQQLQNQIKQIKLSASQSLSSTLQLSKLGQTLQDHSELGNTNQSVLSLQQQNKKKNRNNIAILSDILFERSEQQQQPQNQQQQQQKQQQQQQQQQLNTTDQMQQTNQSKLEQLKIKIFTSTSKMLQSNNQAEQSATKEDKEITSNQQTVEDRKQAQMEQLNPNQAFSINTALINSSMTQLQNQPNNNVQVNNNNVDSINMNNCNDLNNYNNNIGSKQVIMETVKDSQETLHTNMLTEQSNQAKVNTEQDQSNLEVSDLNYIQNQIDMAKRQWLLVYNKEQIQKEKEEKRSSHQTQEQKISSICYSIYKQKKAQSNIDIDLDSLIKANKFYNQQTVF